MADFKTVAEAVTKRAAEAAGVAACHAPSPLAGERIIYRYSPGKYDGEFETVTVTMRFISADIAQALSRAQKVSAVLCRPGDRGVRLGGDTVYTVREDGGNSGYIGKTGHYYVLTRFNVKYRRSAVENTVIVK